MLRDVLCSLDGVETWPCDEINYIWRHGNISFPSDEIPPSKVTAALSEYIHRQFNWVAAKYGAHTVVEKTCASSLRIPFVDKVLPDSKYIFIYRDGIDAVGSARLRWTATLDIPYLLEKVRFVPLLDLPVYALRYFKSRLHRLTSSDKRLAFWGPILHDMDEILINYTLNEVCAIQWQRCIESAENAFREMPQDRVFRLSYEEFVSQPELNLINIAKFLSLEFDQQAIEKSIAKVSSESVGKGREALGDSEVEVLEKLVGETLGRYGY
tara:strand:+ start:15696 stop:16499 length:804 start_codon:yes stop_codon:yes gene_type:complete